MALKTIWKFPLGMVDSQDITIPQDYSILSADLDPDGRLCIWVAVDPDALKRSVNIRIVGTGNPIHHVGDFIGTVRSGRYVWHIFTGPADSANRPQGMAYHYLTSGRV